jgi:hypothetical protein
METRNVSLTYLPIFLTGQTVLDGLIEGLLENYKYVFINFGLHDISRYTKMDFQRQLSSRLERLSGSTGRMATPCNMIYLGLWAQRLNMKRSRVQRATDFVLETSSNKQATWQTFYRL